LYVIHICGYHVIRFICHNQKKNRKRFLFRNKKEKVKKRRYHGVRARNIGATGPSVVGGEGQWNESVR
ncbi:TPA: hypothetical protein ACIJRD_003558, partial [Escherichia coli]